jgi:hypothetical protein
MTCEDEGKSNNGQWKKSELLPRGDKAKEIVEVLAEMYRVIYNPEDVRNDDRSEHANRKRDTSPDKGGKEETG